MTINERYLFRGICTWRRIWIYGNVTFGEGKTFILEPDSYRTECPTYCYCEGNCPETHEYTEVIPETVGQWTGILDKNDVKIFEGDMLMFGDSIPRSVSFSKLLGGFYVPSWYTDFMITEEHSHIMCVTGSIHDHHLRKDN